MYDQDLFPLGEQKKRGRPKGSYRSNFTQLNPLENRVALLRAAGMSAPAIAIQIESNAEQVYNILERSHVAAHLTKLTALQATEIAPVARRIEQELEAISGEAFDRQVGIMRDLDELGDDLCEAEDYKNGIRAKLGALTTTQDILDRAGKRAPTKTIGAVVHGVAPEQLERLERILSDIKG